MLQALHNNRWIQYIMRGGEEEDDIRMQEGRPHDATKIVSSSVMKDCGHHVVYSGNNSR